MLTLRAWSGIKSCDDELMPVHEINGDISFLPWSILVGSNQAGTRKRDLKL